MLREAEVLEAEAARVMARSRNDGVKTGFQDRQDESTQIASEHIMRTQDRLILYS